MSRDNAALLDALTYAREISRIIDGMTKDEFLANTTIQYALLYLFAVVGEAVARLSSEFRADHPETTWKAVVGMRNILIHRYDRVNLDRVWAATTDALPDFIAAIEQLVVPLPDE